VEKACTIVGFASETFERSICPTEAAWVVHAGDDGPKTDQKCGGVWCSPRNTEDL